MACPMTCKKRLQEKSLRERLGRKRRHSRQNGIRREDGDFQATVSPQQASEVLLLPFRDKVQLFVIVGSVILGEANTMAGNKGMLRVKESHTHTHFSFRLSWFSCVEDILHSIKHFASPCSYLSELLHRPGATARELRCCVLSQCVLNLLSGLCRPCRDLQPERCPIAATILLQTAPIRTYSCLSHWQIQCHSATFYMHVPHEDMWLH